MNEQVVIEFVIGLFFGVVICLGKEFLMQRYFMRGNTFISMLLFFGRLVVDVIVMLIAFQVSVYALIGVALGLVSYVNYLLFKAVGDSASSLRKR